jgi:hypothetical protein
LRTRQQDNILILSVPNQFRNTRHPKRKLRGGWPGKREGGAGDDESRTETKTEPKKALHLLLRKGAGKRNGSRFFSSYFDKKSRIIGLMILDQYLGSSISQ